MIRFHEKNVEASTRESAKQKEVLFLALVLALLLFLRQGRFHDELNKNCQ